MRQCLHCCEIMQIKVYMSQSSHSMNKFAIKQSKFTMIRLLICAPGKCPAVMAAERCAFRTASPASRHPLTTRALQKHNALIAVWGCIRNHRI